MSPPRQMGEGGEAVPLTARSTRTSGLQKLPYEIMSYIVRDLTIEEVFDLALCNRHFQYLIREESFCKAVIKSKAAYSTEAQQAIQSGQYARALRRLVKRRRAISAASPFCAALVGVADSFHYAGGKLCYVLEDRPFRRWLRILDLQQATNDEIVVDIPLLVATAVPRAADCRKYNFRVLQHACGITSCLFSFAKPATENWLLVFDALKHELLGAMPLESAARIFVRNTAEHLYFGTHSEYGADGFRKWVLRYFDLQKRQLRGQKLHLSDVVGHEMGSTVCFEIIDDHLYGLSNQTAFEMEEIDWTSYYYCFRFRLDDPDPERALVMRKRDSWRRQHAEGPIDDRWGFLSLEKDEATGGVRIVESRKEWLAGQSGNRRTYYYKDVVFRAQERNDDDGSEEEEEGGGDGAGAGNGYQDDNVVDELPYHDPLTSLLGVGNKPNYMAPQIRLPSEFHSGDDGSVMFTRSKTFLRSYHHSCKTFLDLVDDPLPSSPGTQRLRLRAGAKDHSTTSEPLSTDAYSQGTATTTTTALAEQQQQQNKESDNSNQNYSNRISYWPPSQQAAGPTNPHLDMVTQILSPPDGCLGNNSKSNSAVTAVGDERSVIYATAGEKGMPKSLVYISFDPVVRLAGMTRGGSLPGETEGPDGNNDDDVYYLKYYPDGTSKGKSVDRPVAAPGAWASSEMSCITPMAQVESSPAQDLPSMVVGLPEGVTRWAWVEKAFHHNFPWKYTFAL